MKVYSISESITGEKCRPQKGKEDHTRVLSVRETISIGRDHSIDFVLNHPMVSRNHARIEHEAGQYILYD
nr:FHA domain-containing protein [Candidatus Contubernalis alkalaceticus]